MMKKLIAIIAFLAIIQLPVGAQWTNDPLINTIVNDLSGEQAVPHIAFDNSGNFYIGFYSNNSGNYDIRLQYFNYEGEAQWADDGLLVSNHPQNSWITDWDLTVDNTGNCVLAFNDVRDGNANVYAYAISPSGSFLWGADGIQLTNASTDEYVPSITVNAQNNTIVAWSRPTAAENEVVMQKITPGGTLSWGSAGITYQSGSENYTGARVLGVEGDNFILGYYRETGNFPALTRHIYAQKFDGTGSAVWTSDVLVSSSNGISPYNNFNIASDGANGIIFAWTDDRNSDNNIDAAVNRVLSDGTSLWPANGSVVNTATNSDQNPQILGVNSSNETMVVWDKKNTNQSQTAISGQKFSASGSREWTDGGVDFVAMSADVGGVVGGNVFDGTYGMAAYDVSVGGNAYNIKAIGFDDNGSTIWTPASTLMAGRSTEKVHTISSGLYNDMMVVTWEEGSSSDIYMQNIYTDGSIGDPPLSDDATLSDLTVNSITVDGFQPDVHYYEMGIPTGDPLPITGATANDSNATVDITQAAAVPGTATVLVTAEDGTTQLTYTIDFHIAGTDATLTDLTVDGVTIAGFDPNIFTYDYSVPTGDPIPVVGATAADPYATLTITQATTLPGAGVVEVTSEDGQTTNIYTVNFLYNPGTDATLQDLLVGGVTIDGFDPGILNYNYTVIYPNPAPYVQGIPNDPLATVVENQCLSIPGDGTVEVTAEDGVTQLTYTVSFVYEGYDATLSDLTVDEVTIDGFDPQITYYEYIVDDPQVIPVVDGTTTDPDATLTITQAQEIPGEAELLVVAADGVTEMTYTVYFYALGTDATLADLTVDGNTIEGFDPLVFEYMYFVVDGQPIPVLDGTPNDPLAQITINQATEIPGEGNIHVLAQDGINENTYRIYFDILDDINEYNKNKIAVYPNPAINYIYVNGIKGSIDIKIIDLLGNIVLTSVINGNDKLQIADLTSGIYFATIMNERGDVKTVRFVKR